MLSKLKFFFAYFLLWTGFFGLCRAVFLSYHNDEAAQLGAATMLKTFTYGLRMDLSMAAYITAPAGLFIALSPLIRFLQRPVLYKVYTSLVLFFVLLITISDLQVFTQWGFRIDATPLKYLSSPKEVWASISHLPVFLYLAIFLFVFITLVYLLARLLNRWSAWLRNNRFRFLQPLVLLGITAALIIPIRGGLQLAPMNQSAVYFSPVNFANQAALNAPWNLLYGVVSESLPAQNPYHYMPGEEAVRLKDSLYRKGAMPVSVLHTNRPNIILVIWESFTEKATKLVFEGKEVTPYFNALKKEGLYFARAFSSGDRTDKGISAILSGYPALPQSSVIRIPNKAAKLQVLSHPFQKAGYTTSFYYGGEPEFANIKSYLLHAGFDPLVTIADFDQEDLNSKWGAHDGVVAQRLLKDLHGKREPFFTTWLTLSSHEPFETPEAPAFRSRDNTAQFLNSLHYTDKVLHSFIRSCEKEPWWQNTLLVVVADHGHPLPETGKKADNFNIPILWLGGALKAKGQTVQTVVSQLDLATTITAQCGFASNLFPYSKDMLATGGPAWAFFTFNNGFGWADSSGRFVFDNVGRRMQEQDTVVSAAALRAAKAMQQHSFADYLVK